MTGGYDLGLEDMVLNGTNPDKFGYLSPERAGHQKEATQQCMLRGQTSTLSIEERSTSPNDYQLQHNLVKAHHDYMFTRHTTVPRNQQPADGTLSYFGQDLTFPFLANPKN